jgi:ribosome biogenesis GTPase
MASNDDKERQRRDYLRGAEREREQRENRRLAAGRGKAGGRGGRTRDRTRYEDPLDPDDADGSPDRPEFQRIRRRRAEKAKPTRTTAAAPEQVVGTGCVVARHRTHLVVERAGREDSPPWTVPTRRDDEPVAVGDEVELSLQVEDGTFRLARRLPRRSVIERPDPGDPSRRARLTLAANVDVLVGVQPLSRLRPGLVDRLAVAALAAGIEFVVCLHKIDLLAGDDHRESLDSLNVAVDAIESRAAAFGVRVVRTSCPPDGPPDVSALRAAIAGRIAVLVGPSGAGKSSLANALIPDLDLATTAVRAGDGKGRHTTTASHLFRTEDGGALIDTPGVRSFGLERPDRDVLARAFPEIAAAARGCGFRDCRHAEEPGCEVREAVASGRVAAARFASWQRLTQDDEDIDA